MPRKILRPEDIDDRGLQVRIPKALAIKIFKITKNGEYDDVPDFVREAIRRRIEEIEKSEVKL